MGSPFEQGGSAEAFDAATFLVASRELLAAPSEAAVARFLRSFPLSSLVQILQTGDQPDVQRAALACLRIAVKSEAAGPELLGFLPALEQGLFSPVDDIKDLSCLAARRIGEISAQAAGREAARKLLVNKVILRGLLGCLQGSTSLATSAADAVAALCSSSGDAATEFFSEPTLTQFKDMLTRPTTEVQQRAIALSARLAGANPAIHPVLIDLRVVEVLLDMIGGQGDSQEAGARQPGTLVPSGHVTGVAPLDELAALTACELLTDFLRQPGSASIIAQNAYVHGRILYLLSLTADPSRAATAARVSAGTVGLVVRAAWKLAAYLVSPPSLRVPSPLPSAQAEDYLRSLAKVCECLSPGVERVAPGDIRMSEAEEPEVYNQGEDSVDTANWEEAVCEASSIVSSRVRGASLLLKPGARAVVVHVCKRAFGSLPRQHVTSDLQVAALHSLASILGSERGEASHGPVGSTGTSIVYPPQDVELDSEAEGQLREALYYTAASARGGPTLGGVLLMLLKQHELVRVAVYRIITVLVERPWGLAEVCGNRSVVDTITDALSETNKEAMDWRHTSVVAAATAASTHTTAGSGGALFTTVIPSETLSKLEAAAKMGPYAVRRIIEARPIVAVEERF